jgi:hypothetical protein
MPSDRAQSGGSVTPFRPAGSCGEPSRYNYLVLEDSSRDNSVGVPWFLSGDMLYFSGGQAARVCKAPYC